MIAEVIVDIASGETDRIFDYLCDDDVVVGSRVRAPFGPKTLPGFVMNVKTSSSYPKEKLKKVLPCDDELPALTPECLRLANKMAERYRVPHALTLRLFLPTEMRTGKVRELTRNYAELIAREEYEIAKNAKNQWGVVEYLRKNGKADCAILNR
jgi:primosomal protein N' (replication factor Y)